MATILAIIPARGGSKRIPKKNIKNFLGRPIISYPIETVKKSGLFDEIMVSTDSTEIAEIAKSFGASIPFLRSKDSSGDLATTADVVEEVLKTYKDKKFDFVCCIYPTAVFVKPDMLKKSAGLLKAKSADSVFTCARFNHPIERAFKKEGDLFKMASPENMAKRTQDLEPKYYDAGQFYFLDVKSFLSDKKLFSLKTMAIEIGSGEVQDIDNESDWEVAEEKYKIVNHLS